MYKVTIQISSQKTFYCIFESYSKEATVPTKQSDEKQRSSLFSGLSVIVNDIAIAVCLFIQGTAKSKKTFGSLSDLQRHYKVTKILKSYEGIIKLQRKCTLV